MSNAKTFKEDDVVSRQIGGPLMTVEDIRSDALVACVWMDLEAHVQRDVFAPNTLWKWVRAEAEDDRPMWQDSYKSMDEHQLTAETNRLKIHCAYTSDVEKRLEFLADELKLKAPRA